MSLKEFVDVLDVSCFRLLIKPDELEKDNNYNYGVAASSFLLNPKSDISSSFTIGPMRLNIRLIQYLVNHILLPRIRKLSYLTKFGVGIIWLLSNKVETNWASEVIHHMLGSKSKSLFLWNYMLAGIIKKLS